MEETCLLGQSWGGCTVATLSMCLPCFPINTGETKGVEEKSTKEGGQSRKERKEEDKRKEKEKIQKRKKKQKMERKKKEQHRL
jgi:hypothetical protein